MNPNPEKLQPLLINVINDMGAAANAALVIVGEQLGLYRALADHGPATADELARATGTHERYVREWVSAQAASGLVTYDAAAARFSLSPEQAAVFADEQGEFYMAGGFQPFAAVFENLPRLAGAFRTGEGIGWGEHCSCLFCGTARFYRTGYNANLLANWLPALDGVAATLDAGVKVADIGCGHGVSTLIMADAFPNSEFIGFDVHPASIEHARASVGERANVRFEVARAQDYPGSDYGFATMFDAFHDMGDPAGAAAHVRETLRGDGVLMLVEPLAGDDLADNLNPIGRLFYAMSTNICVPTALSQEVGAALGAQAGEQRLTEALNEGGFGRVRRAAETPFNMVLEARV